MKQMWAGLLLAAACGFSTLAACGDDDDDNTNPSTKGAGGQGGSSGGGAGGMGGGKGGTSGGGAAGSPAGGDAQTPPQGAAAIEAWLAKGDYKKWDSEPAIHESRSPSPHGFNRIYSNDLIAANGSGTDAWPEGAAAVKELYAGEDDGGPPIGYAVYLKTKADSAGGANWYWYERLPEPQGVVADGLGNAGGAKDICVACHAAAGADAEHTPTPGGRDQVYTPVQSPPQGAAEVEAWLAKGEYKKWDSEPAIHESRSPSPHGFNRIFSNKLIAASATGTGAWPLGAAAVKELYAGEAGGTPIGYAVYLKTQEDSADGANWYWY
ncbi:MAG TPA: cytochrome P460 family protein, partial [Polyangiaceae bacterium]|nr:cytochrome P460 family protein [Polyangiaceae bacterium]